MCVMGTKVRKPTMFMSDAVQDDVYLNKYDTYCKINMYLVKGIVPHFGNRSHFLSCQEFGKNIRALLRLYSKYETTYGSCLV